MLENEEEGSGDRDGERKTKRSDSGLRVGSDDRTDPRG